MMIKGAFLLRLSFNGNQGASKLREGAPNNSFKPNPHRGTAWVLFRYASTQAPPRYGSA